MRHARGSEIWMCLKASKQSSSSAPRQALSFPVPTRKRKLWLKAFADPAVILYRPVGRPLFQVCYLLKAESGLLVASLFLFGFGFSPFGVSEIGVSR